MADGVYAALVAGRSATSEPQIELHASIVSKQLKWFLKQCNLKWTGSDGKLLPNRVKLSLTLSRLCKILGPEKIRRINPRVFRVTVPPDVAPADDFRCDICSRQFKSQRGKEQHDASEGHQINAEKQRLLRANTEATLTLSFPGFAHGQTVVIGRGEKVSGNLTFANLFSTSIKLLAFRTFPQVSDANLAFVGRKLPLHLGENKSVTFKVDLNFPELTADKVGIIADFVPVDPSGKIMNPPLIKVIILDFIVVDQVAQSLGPTGPYTRPKQPPKDASKNHDIIDGEKPESETCVPFSSAFFVEGVSLPHSPLPVRWSIRTTFFTSLPLETSSNLPSRVPKRW